MNWELSEKMGIESGDTQNEQVSGYARSFFKISN